MDVHAFLYHDDDILWTGFYAEGTSLAPIRIYHDGTFHLTHIVFVFYQSVRDYRHPYYKSSE